MNGPGTDVTTAVEGEPVIEVRGVEVSFTGRQSLLRGLSGSKGTVAKAVDGVDLTCTKARCWRSPVSPGAGRRPSRERSWV